MKSLDKIYGIDFSGAKDAGKKIWIAKGAIEGGSLLIEDCFRAMDLPNSGKSLDNCLPALLELINKSRDAAFGLDFPFGLPKRLIEEDSWIEFVSNKEKERDSRKDRKGHRRTLRRKDGRVLRDAGLSLFKEQQP